MYNTPYRTPLTKQRGLQGGLLSSIRSSRMPTYTNESIEPTLQSFQNFSNPALAEENAHLKEMNKSLQTENAKLREKETMYKLQLAELKGEIDELKVYKDLFFTLQSGRTIGEFQMEKPIPQPTQKTVFTPTKPRLAPESAIATTSFGDYKPKASGYYGIKPSRPPVSQQVIEDSLLSDDFASIPHSHPVLQLSGSKRDSLTLGELSIIASKRIAGPLTPEEESNVSLCIQRPSPSHPPDQRQSLPGARELSFRSYSSIISENGDSSILQVYNPPVNFQSISFSDLHESDGGGQEGNAANHHDPSNQPLDRSHAEMNVDEMSYSALLQLESQQGGVLNDRWDEVRDEVLSVRRMVGLEWMCISNKIHKVYTTIISFHFISLFIAIIRKTVLQGHG